MPSVALARWTASALDWPNWRGPDFNGISTETNWSARALDGEPRILWRAKIGTGFSSFAVAGGRVYTSGDTTNSTRSFAPRPTPAGNSGA